MATKPRPYTPEEVRAMFIQKVREAVNYWATVDNGGNTAARLSGLAHTILASCLDGCSIELPAFMIIPNPHLEDKEWLEAQGENWFAYPALEEDIGGGLHEILYAGGWRAKGDNS